MPLDGIKTLLGHSSGSTAQIGVNASGNIIAQHETGDQFILGSATSADSVYVPDLTSLTGEFDGQLVVARGHTTDGDGGGGAFIWSAGALDVTNGGTIFQAGTGAWFRLETTPLNVKWFGAVGDGLANDTTALQQAIDVGSGPVYLPPGTYRIIAPLVFPNDAVTREFYGAGRTATVIVANFTSVGLAAALTVVGTSPARAFAVLRDFQLQGISDANTTGIFCDWSSGLSAIHNVYVTGFKDGIVVGRTYDMTIADVTVTACLRDGVVLGRLLDDTSVTLTNARLLNGLTTMNTRHGVACEGRNIWLVGWTSEHNTVTDIYATQCLGLSINGYHESGVGKGTTAQIHLTGCRAVTVDGVNVSGWATGQKIVNVDGCVDVNVRCLSVENGGGPTVIDSYGVYVKNSYNVSISGDFDNVKYPVFVDTSARISLEISVNNSGAGACVSLTLPSGAGAVWWNALAATVALATIDVGAYLVLHDPETGNVGRAQQVSGVWTPVTPVVAGGTGHTGARTITRVPVAGPAVLDISALNTGLATCLLLTPDQACTITNFTNAVDGQVIHVLVDAAFNVTLSHAGQFVLPGGIDWVGGIHSAITLVYTSNDSYWHHIASTINNS